ncbi:unnamed protein product [Heterobilharzia americana]|nr:unnamed protein product [Heterobilharzia americana]
MWRSETKIAVKLIILSVSVHLSWPGSQFLVNQFIYYRFLNDAGLPYKPSERNKSLPDPDQKTRDEVQEKTAHFLPLLNIAVLVPGIASSFIISSLSDRYGRRVAMGVLFIGLTSNVIISSFVILLGLNLHILILGNLICGLLGGGLLTYTGQISVCFADITKVSNKCEEVLHNSKSHQASLERQRLLYMGIYDGICVLATAAGISLTGVLIDRYSFITSCLLLLFLCAVSVGVLWCLPETQSLSTQVSDHCSPDSHFDPMGSQSTVGFQSNDYLELSENSWLLKMTAMFNLVRNASVTTTLVVVVLFLTTLITYNEGQYTFLYLMGPPFNWSVDQYGYYSGFSNTLLGLLSFILTVVTIRWMKVVKKPRTSASEPLLTNQPLSSYNSIHEVDSIDLTGTRSSINPIVQNQVLRARRRMIKYVMVGMFSVVISKLFMGIAFLLSSPGHNILVFVSLIICVFRSAIVPVLKSFTSSLYPPELQNRLFSVIAVCEYLSLIVGMVTLPYIYAATVASCSGTVFLVSSSLAFVALLLLLFVSRYTKKEIRNLGLNQLNIIEMGDSTD